MKTIYKLSILAALALSSFGLNAQVKDGVPELNVYNKDNVKLIVGGRFMADMAYYKTPYTPMKSGVNLVEARMRSTYIYNQWTFYMDFDFAGGKVHQKNIFLKYDFANSCCKFAKNSLKIGYYNEPSTMSLNTSKYNLHFMTRAAGVLALSPGRSFGITFKSYNDHFFANQGVFLPHLYNQQEVGSQGFSLSGRWLYKPFGVHGDYVVHVGLDARFARINSGVQQKDWLYTTLTYKAPLETKVDPKTLSLEATMPWARNQFNLGLEALFCSQNYFVRSEYLRNYVTKYRPYERQLINALGVNPIDGWTNLPAFKNYYPLRTSVFQAAYVEAGVLLLGDRYAYDNANGVLKGINNPGDLELVARYSYTQLNDITPGEFYFIGKNKAYTKVIADYQASTTSIWGGNLHNIVLGLNYTLNHHAKLMFAYQFSLLKSYEHPMDNMINTLQGRIMFAF